MGWVFRKIVFVANFDNTFRVHLGNYSILGNESKQLYQNFICLLLLIFVPTIFKYTWKQNEWISDSCYMNEPWKRSAKWNKPDTEHNSMCLSRVDKFTQPERALESARIREGLNGGLRLPAHRALFGATGELRSRQWRWLYSIVNGIDATALCTKMATNAYFMVYLLQ